MPPRKKRRATSTGEPPPSDRIQTQPVHHITDLPPDILVEILAHLDHDDLFAALQASKAMASAAAAPEAAAPGALWHRLCLARGFVIDQDPSNWRTLYRTAFQAACCDCFQPTTRRSFGFAPLTVRLCQVCWKRYADAPLPSQRLIPKTQAKQRWCLKDSHLGTLPHAVDANPVNPAFAGMHLYWLRDVRGAAVRAFGSEEAVTRERQRRLTRR